jgi:serine/threonine protein kinase
MQSKIILGKYQLQKKLTDSLIGEVFQGGNLADNQKVIITILRPDIISSQNFQDKLKSVADKLNSFQSPYAIPLLEFGEQDGQTMVVQAAFTGQTLSEILQDSKGLSLDMVLDIAQQTSEYLRDLHLAKIVHGGLSPHTIPLTHRGTIQVLDAGLAQALDLSELLKSGSIQATPYHSPELRTGNRLTPGVDYYALGAILYEALTGKTLEFDPKDSFPGSVIPGLPPELDELVNKCLARAPDHRIQSTAELFNGIREIHRGIRLGAQDTMLGMEDALVGHTLGAYQLTERLGQGGMATVYKAYEPTLDRYVAIKVLPQFFARDPNFMERFRREARAVAQLSHPNIVPIHSFGEQGVITYIAMQYVTGGTLKQTRGQVYDTEQALKLIIPIANALSYAHQNGIIHRDIKPSNVLMTAGDWPLLADFGLAKMAENSGQLTGTGVGVGTPMYMSPEQGQGTGVDHRTDIYSLGIMLYEMLTGDVPFKADTPMAIVIKHMTAPMPMPRQIKPDIPEELERIILKATAKNPNDRYQTADEMVTTMEMVAGLLAARRFGVAAAPDAPSPKAAPLPHIDTEAEKQQAQLSSLESQTEAAIRQKDWEAAQETCQAALELTPNDQNWLDKLATIQAAQQEEIEAVELQTKIAELKTTAGTAIEAENWSAAIHSLQAALDLDPTDTEVSLQLSEAQDARQIAQEAAEYQSGIERLLATADAAQSTEDWDTAIINWEEYLSLEPDDHPVRSKLQAAHQAHREAQLAHFKMQAQEATESENWEVAIPAWEGYLALEPDDQTEATADLQKSRQFNQVASDYAAAQKLVRKRPNQAIELLQGITAQVPAYKETAQLIAKAEARRDRKPIWKRPLVIGIASAIILVILGFFFAPGLINQFTSRTTVTPVVVEHPPSETAAAPHPAEAFAAPIRAALVDRPPDFEEDFSSPEDYWSGFYFFDDSEVSLSDMVSDGTLHLVDDDPKRWYDFQKNMIWGRNVALQFDFMSDGTARETHVYFNIRGSQTDLFYRFSLQVNGYWAIHEDGLEADPEKGPLQEGNIELEINQFHTLMLIAIDDQFAIYLDDEPLAYFEDSRLAGQENALGAFSTYSYRTNGAALKVDMDNIQFWNLEGAEFSGVAITPTLDPAIQAALDAIQNEEPAFQHSFDFWDLGDPIENIKVAAGKLIVTSERPGQHPYINLSNLSSDMFAVEFELSISESGSQEGRCYFESTNGEEPTESLRTILAGFSSSGIANLDHYVHPDQWPVLTANTFEVSNPNIVTLIVLGEQITALVDGQILYTALDPDGSAFYYRHVLAAETNIGCEFDNYKIWDLSEGQSGTQEEETSFYEPVLAYIEAEVPTFNDDFSVPTDSWEDFGVGRDNSGWPLSVDVVDEALVYTYIGENVTWNAPSYENGIFTASNFVLEYEFEPTEDMENIGFLGFHIRGNENAFYSFRWNPSSATWTTEINVLNPDAVNFSGTILAETEESIASPTRFRVIAFGDTFAIFANDQLVTVMEDSRIQGDSNSIFFSSRADFQIKINNIKFWNMDGAEIQLEKEDLASTETIQPFYEPLVLYKYQTEPTFKDSFSSPDMVWGSTSEELSIFALVESGKLRITDHAVDVDMGSDHGVPGLGFPTNKLFNASDFILQYDFSFAVEDASPVNEVGVQFRTNENQTTGYKVVYEQAGSWTLFGDDQTAIATGTFSPKNTNTTYLITQQNQLAIFVNDKLLHQTDSLAFSGTTNLIWVSGQHGSGVIFDNVHFWNLDGVEVGEQDTTSSESFGETVLEYLDSTAPSFEDDFETADRLVWGYTSEIIPIDEDLVYGSKLTITDHQEQPGGGVPNDHAVPGLTFPTNGLFQAENFALQFDFSFFNRVDEIGIQFRNPYNQKTGYAMNFSSNGAWNLTQNEGATTISTGQSSLTGWYNALLLIVKDQNLAVYLNDELVHEADNLDFFGTFNEIFLLGDEHGSEGKFDNVKFWNLNGVDF